MLNVAVLVSVIAAVANAQGVTSAISPNATAPTGCSTSFDGQFGFYIKTLSASATPLPVVKARTYHLPPGIRPRALLEDTPSRVERQAANAVIEARQATESEPEACQSNNTLTMTLENSVMKDKQNRIAYIASNRQFQFDGPPQAGAIYTAGFSTCDDGAIALGGSKTFYQCLSGDFYNLYDQYWAPQCMPVQMMLVKLIDCESGGMISRSPRKDVQR